MLFSKVFKANPIQSFELNLGGANSSSIAFGAGSVINGSVKLLLDKPITIKSIRVLFKCEEWEKKKEPSSTLFSVESCIWTQKQVPYKEAEKGSHIYLFAIQLPSSVNYPPSIRDAYLGHRIEYNLQGFLDFEDESTKSTAVVPLTYLPLVTFDDHYMNNMNKKEKTIKIEKGNEHVQVTAKLVNPSSCPGDSCSVKLYTHNKSSYNINQVHIMLISTATSLHLASSNSNKYPDLPTASGPSYHHKQRQILTESYYVSIPKHTNDITSICPFKVPSYCVPTTQCHFGKYIDIKYEVVVIIPTMGNSINFNSSDISGGSSTAAILTNPQAIRLPLIVTTIPYSSVLPPKLQIPFADENNTEVPTFIKSQESPLPSPNTFGQPSPDGAWSPGSPMEFPITIDDMDSLTLPQSRVGAEDAAGFLMVPPITSNSARRSISIHSIGSC